jgi:AraC family transcriptional regulator
MRKQSERSIMSDDMSVAPSRDRSDTGQLRTLARTGLVRVAHFRHNDRPHSDPKEELFDRPAIIFTLIGSWGFSAPGVTADVHEGVVVLAAPGVAYRTKHHESIPTDECFYVAFNAEPWEALVQARDAGSELPPLNEILRVAAVPRTRQLAALQAGLMREASTDSPARPLKLDLLAAQLVIELHRSRHGVLPRANATDLSIGAARAKAYIDRHFNSEITLTTLAGVSGLSVFRLAHVFRAAVGVSPHQYLLRVRIGRAIELLCAGSMSALEIALEVGFQSASHFSSTFGRLTGVTPSEYRRLASRRSSLSRREQQELDS